MLVSLGMYFFVVQKVHPDHPSDNPNLVFILLAAAVGSAVASFVVKRLFQSRARNESNPALYRSGFIIALVLCEAAGLMGLVAWFVTASPQYYLFLLVAVVAMLLHFPRRAS